MTTLTAQSLDDLKAHPLNPKQHAAEQLDASLGEFGFIEPVVVDERTGLLLSGHGRVEALRRLRDAGGPPPAHVKVAKGKWMIPTVTGWSSRDDTDAHAAMIALNRATERGGWDEPQLLDLLQGLDLDDELLSAAVGYTDSEMLILERLVEADTTFADLTENNQGVIDEFKASLGVEIGDVQFKYDTALRVFFLTPEARVEFYEKIGYKPDMGAKHLRYPPASRAEPLPTWDGPEQ